MSTHADQILAALKAAGQPKTAYELLDVCSGSAKIAPPQVYRALDKLVAQGLVHRIDSLKAYVACDHPGHGSVTAFQICDSCGLVSEAPAPKEVLSSHDFQVMNASVELHGLCASCKP